LDPKILGVTASSAKTDYLIDLIESTDEKIVIFSCFEKYIFFLSKLFPKAVQITGERTVLQRAEAVKVFQEQDEVQLCLGTIQSMGEGVTLTSASNVVMADRWWNEPTNQQAIDRLHRIGQKNAVQVMYPIVDESVDSTLDSILERKDQASQGYFSENRVKSGVFEERMHKVRTEVL
jgi:SNF2 family DNA or RNA helicase